MECSFKKGEIVAAKVAGFPWWPGIIAKINLDKKIALVNFIGHCSHAYLNFQFINSFTERLEIMKNSKNRALQKATQIATDRYIVNNNMNNSELLDLIKSQSNSKSKTNDSSELNSEMSNKFEDNIQNDSNKDKKESINTNNTTNNNQDRILLKRKRGRPKIIKSKQRLSKINENLNNETIKTININININISKKGANTIAFDTTNTNNQDIFNQKINQMLVFAKIKHNRLEMSEKTEFLICFIDKIEDIYVIMRVNI